MADPILADQIRAFTYGAFIQPGFASSELVRVRVGDVHSAMGFTQRVPLICASLRARQFCEQFGLKLIQADGPKTSTTTTFSFVRAANKANPMSISSHAVSWAEITSIEHGHGGLGWDLGRWLWSPTKSKDGADRYSIMQQPAPGDQVFHLVSGVSQTTPRQRILYGVSRVAAAAEVTKSKPPAAGVWASAGAYFRVALADFTRFDKTLSMDDVEAELADIILSDLAERPKYYPYAPYRDGFRGAQGIYLTKLSPALACAFREVGGLVALAEADDARDPRTVIREFAEGERARRESAFFKRNPALRAAAIATHGTRCVACKIGFGDFYGSLGEGYIEVHHLNPLSERLDSLRTAPAVTTVNDVVPLCANCHRMVHRRRPALSIDELQLAISSAPMAGGR